MKSLTGKFVYFRDCGALRNGLRRTLEGNRNCTQQKTCLNGFRMLVLQKLVITVSESLAKIIGNQTSIEGVS